MHTYCARPRRPCGPSHTPPTWSWAACEYPVQDWPLYCNRQPEIVVKDATVIPRGKDPLGELSFGCITLLARIRRCFIKYQERYPSVSAVFDECHILIAGDEWAEETIVFKEPYIFSDGPNSLSDGHEIVEAWWMRLSPSVGILLKPVAGELDTFVGVGLLRSTKVRNWALEVPAQIVKLV